ncbi:DMT family transporter [Ruegeria sp. 2205SS24-7]|uniref:DMT family transporter n=1 Tax=Ruegeria discodermiae TaxID=3064389 RepID=UPI0027409040|nr:DMT family transporter [Ruegeria sp. 2205SS24-7]MDP5219215.1 DMT family transporter [Ruegeria sp. 2205SS24-7]
MGPVAKSMDVQDWGLLVFLSILWGATFFWAGVAVKELPPLTVVLIRVGLAALALLPLLFWAGHRLPRSLSGWVPFLGMGLLNNVLPFGFIFAGQTQIGVGLSAIINSMTPLFTVLVMAGFGEERLTRFRLIGVLMGVGGVGVLNGGGAALQGGQILGIALCMAGAMSYGFAALWARRRLANVPPLKSATCQLMCSTAILLPVVTLIDRPWTLAMPSDGVLYAMVALAVLGTALAYLVFFRILASAGPSNVMLVTLLIPVTAILLGWALLDEAVTARDLIGAGVIGLGLLFIDGRIPSRLGGVRRARS